MRCLHCNKELSENDLYELKNQWHKRCVKEFFGTEELPRLDVTKEQLEQLVNDSVNKGLTVPGAQKKMSLHLETKDGSRLTIVNYPTGYILKPQADGFAYLPEYEFLGMLMSKETGIATAPFALIKLDSAYAYITKRIDRVIAGKKIEKYAMEDFCQLSEKLAEDKYRGSYEACGRVIARYSNYKGLDLAELFLRVVFSFVIGNSDLHLKNFSLIESAPGSRVFGLSKAYDILSVNVAYPADIEEMALSIAGKKNRIEKQDFLALAQNIGLDSVAANNIIEKVVTNKETYYNLCRGSYLPEKKQAEIMALITNRINKLWKSS